MRIVFGMQLDGTVWSNEKASMGEVRTGPMGLLSILEKRLGIGMQSVHPVYRIDEYMKRLQLIDRKSEWFHESFTIDPWSTARQLHALLQQSMRRLHRKVRLLRRPPRWVLVLDILLQSRCF